MRIKVVHILDSLGVGGLENGVVNLVNSMNHDKFQHTLCCLRKIGPMAERIIRKDTEILCLNKQARDYFMALKLATLIKKVKPDIVHTRNWGTIDGIIAASLAGVNRVIHGEHGKEYYKRSRQDRNRNLVRRVLARRVNHFVAVSSEIKSWLIHQVKIPDNKVMTIMNGVDTEKFCPPADSGEAKNKVGFDRDSWIVGTVGRLDKVKDYIILLKAMTILGEHANNANLVFVGDGPERSNLEAFVRDAELSNVYFFGQKENSLDFLRAFDLFVLPSLYEGISNSILEAMASGVPVLATNVGGNPELVENEVTGSLVHSGDYLALAKEIFRYLNDRDKCLKFGQAARLRCEKLFSLNVMLNKYDLLYSRLMHQQ